MRIISKFHDYYDIGMSEGQDQTLVYNRLSEEDTQPLNHYSSLSGEQQKDFQRETSWVDKSMGMGYQWLVIGFCGKVFQCLMLEVDVETPCPNSKAHKMNITKRKLYCYTAGAVRQAFFKHASKDNLLEFQSRVATSKYSMEFEHHRNSIKFLNVQKRFYEWNNDRYEDEFVKLNTPIFVVDRVVPENHRGCIRMRTNVELRQYHFFKVFDPYTAFQEISMFISGVLGVGEPHMIEISDECKRDGKGFNEQSFKTRPGTKPNRKKK